MKGFINASFFYSEKAFRFVINRKLFLVLFVLIFLVGTPYFLYINQNGSYFPAFYRLSTQFALGAWCSIVASLVFSWVLYLYRDKLKKLFLVRDLVTIRVPLMLGSAPLFVSKKLGYFEENKIEVDLDFRYAGINTLEDLKNGKCDCAVASDIAIAAFLDITSNLDFKVYSLPFVKITDHIKILVKKNSQITDIAGLANKKIAYIKDSVHHHFLEKVLKTELNTPYNGVLKATIMECFKEVFDDTADACIFWEPHYLSMKNNFDLQEIKINKAYEWFLCLVTTQQFYSKRKSLHNSILNSLKKAVTRCETDSNEVAKDCFNYMLPEFTGVDQNQLHSLLVPTKTHVYKIDETVNRAYKDKLTALHSENYYRGSIKDMQSCLWPDY